jgi:phosphoglycolate phosphatase
MEQNALKNPVYVGDTSGDHQSASQAGIDYIHVSYGFEKDHPAPVVFANFSELVHRLS